MYRHFLILSTVGLIALAAGCTMCSHPYDYCGPTFAGECGQCCEPNARAGSILSGTVCPVADVGVPLDERLEPVLDEHVSPAPTVSSTKRRPVSGWSTTRGSTRVIHKGL